MKQIQTIYFLFYQYYQYEQIKRYPDQILQIQPYDVPSIEKEYNKKSNQNIVILANSRVPGLIN
jgi:predicted Zn-dependent peptidase